MDVRATGEPSVFLFTDIEGSTRLWEQDPEAMASALALHDALLTTAIEAAGGRVFKSVGDAICAVCPGADSALRAAVEGEIALSTADWQATGLDAPLRVRMAIQSGRADAIGDDFAGPVLNRLSRLLRAGHGGQILLTGDVADEVSNSLPAGVVLRDLGERRLRDVPGRVRIVQVVVEGLPAAFLPLDTLEVIEHNLPVPTDPFIGRDEERAKLRAVLVSNRGRLVTLLGPGGIGKTRLATETAREMVDDYPDGVWFVDLTSLRGDDSPGGAVMRVLGLRETPGASDEETVLGWLREREVLLLLDNCEQIIEPVAHFVADVLRSSPHVRILATSRIPLEIRGEQRVPIDPLPLPDQHAGADVGALQEVSSVRLFVSRATSIRPSFSLDTANAPDIAAICRQVEGIPLALELAAARIDLMDPGELRQKLEQRLSSLTGGARDLPTRQRTLRAAIDWSFELLSDVEQQVFCQLSAFTGGWTAKAAEAVIQVERCNDPTLQIESLIAKSLVRRLPDLQDEPRYMMLETIREFASEATASAGFWPTLAKRHTEYFSTLAIENEDELYGPDQDDWFDRIEIDYANYRTAIEWLIQSDKTRAQQLAVALYQYWYVRGGFQEGLRVLQQAVAEDSRPADLLLARALHAQANLHIRLSNFAEAQTILLRSQRLRSSLGDRRGVGAAEINLGFVANELGDLEGAKRHLHTALEVIGTDATPDYRATVLLNLSSIAQESGQLEEARALIQESMALFQQAEDPYGVANSRARLANIIRLEGDSCVAESLLEQACTESAHLKDDAGIAFCQHVSAQLALEHGDLPTAIRDLSSSIAGLSALDDAKMLLETLLTASQILLHAGKPTEAAYLIGSVQAGFRSLNAIPTPVQLSLLETLEEQVASTVQEGDLGRARRAGQALRISTAAEAAVNMLDRALVASSV